jgi:hypothetical protein
MQTQQHNLELDANLLLELEQGVLLFEAWVFSSVKWGSHNAVCLH